MGISNNIAQDGVRRAVDEGMVDAEFAQAYAICLKKMRDGFWTQDYIDICTQKWRSGYDIYDAYAFAHYHYAIYSGQIARITLEVCCEPFPDKEIENNDKALKSISKMFKATFWGGTQDEDGVVGWSESPIAEIHTASDIDGTVHSRCRVNPSRGVPLEVGYTSAAKTLAQMNTGGVARWPYGSKTITILIPVEQTTPIDALDLFDTKGGLIIAP